MNKAWIGAFALSTALSLVARTSRADTVKVISPFDPNEGQLPESITRDPHGHIVVSMAGAHTIDTFVPDGLHAPVPLATLPVAPGAFSVGVKVGPDGDIFANSAAFSAALDAAHVWRIAPGGTVTEVAHLDASGFPNDLVLDDRGDLYVTDSALGLIYKIDTKGNVVVWLKDARLLGNPQHPLLGSPFGANGIVFDAGKRFLYVDNTDFGTVYRVRVGEDRSPGPLELFASDPRLAGADGLAFDDEGDLYVAVDAQGQIARVRRDGGVEVIASGAPLDSPSSLVFARHARDCEDGDQRTTTLFVSSFAIGEATGIAPGTPHPSLDSIDVPFHGLPLP